MIRVGIVGGTGYVAGELLRLLMYHPEAEIAFVYSHSQAGKKVQSIHEDLFMLDNLLFTDTVDPGVDAVFLSLGHGNSTRFLEEHTFSQETKIIDLSNDFRLQADSRWGDRHFVYGLTEKNR